MRGARFGRLQPAAIIAVLAIVASTGLGACNQPTPSPSPAPSGSRPMSGVVPGEIPSPSAGPDLGEAWTTEPDPEAFVEMPDGTMVAPDQFLIMLDPASTQADAEAVAAVIDGTIGGHIEYIGLWKVIVWPSFRSPIISDRLNDLAKQPGVLAASTVGLLTVDADCAPALGDQVYSGSNSASYDMIGVKAAWQAFYASGLAVNPVQVGFLDTVLTRDPNGRIAWEFDDVAFRGEPGTTPDPRLPTPERPSTDGLHHADSTLGILAGDGQDGGIAGIGSPLGSRLVISHDVLNGPPTRGQPSKWTSSDGITYTDDALLKTLRQIEQGATVINGSWGQYSGTGPGGQGRAKMWKAFFDRMAQDHPEVIFVYSAGNGGHALDDTTHSPGGIPAPNVITVGNVNTNGTRVSSSNSVGPGDTGEVTLAAPGNQAVRGLGVDGKVRASGGGTSSAAPMVSATVALIRSIDPSLNAAEIKKMIADTAGQGPAELGGKTLRVDLAVRKAIDGVRARQKLAPLTDKEIAAATAYCQIDVQTELLERLSEPAGATRWDVQLSPVEVRGKTTMALLVGGGRPVGWQIDVRAGHDAAGWVILVPAEGVWITASRLDNGYWIKRWIAAEGETPTPTPSPVESPSSGSSFDCSNPPNPGSLKYLEWAKHCKPIGG